ncbi:unnamed protein product [Ectocarpus sp. 4 AP-2014]
MGVCRRFQADGSKEVSGCKEAAGSKEITSSEEVSGCKEAAGSKEITRSEQVSGCEETGGSCYMYCCEEKPAAAAAAKKKPAAAKKKPAATKKKPAAKKKAVGGSWGWGRPMTKAQRMKMMFPEYCDEMYFGSDGPSSPKRGAATKAAGAGGSSVGASTAAGGSDKTEGEGDGRKTATAGEGEKDEDICKACGKANAPTFSDCDNPINWKCDGCGGGFHEECEPSNSHRRDLCEDARSGNGCIDCANQISCYAADPCFEEFCDECWEKQGGDYEPYF